MNLYTVVIDDESYDVMASGILSAIRKAINSDNLDRLENNWYNLDRECREHPVKVIVKLTTHNLTDEEKESVLESWDND